MNESPIKREALISSLIEELKISFQTSLKEDQKQVTFKKKEVVFYEGSPYDGLYFIDSGIVKIVMKGSNNKNLLLYIAGRGDFLGYPCSLMNLCEYNFTAVALTKAETRFIPRLTFDEILKNNAVVKGLFLELLGLDMQTTNKKMLDLAYKPVRGRLADALLSLNMEAGKDAHDSQISLTRNELANYIGSVRETTTRLLSEFKKEQLIEMNRDFIHVLNPDKLNFISKLYK